MSQIRGASHVIPRPRSKYISNHKASEIFEQLKEGPNAEYELHGEYVSEVDAYRVTATNHVTGAQDIAWVDAPLLRLHPIKSVQPVLQALVNVMSVQP